MKRQKMLLVTHEFPYGNSEYSFLSTEISLLEKKYDLTVLAVLYSGCIDELLYPVSGNYDYSYCKITTYKHELHFLMRDREAWRELLTALSKGSLSQRLKGVKFTIGWLCKSYAVEHEIEKLITQKGCDILYTYWCTEEAAAAVRLKTRFPQMRVMSRLHGYDLFKERNPYGLQPMHRQIADSADLLVFVSRNGMEYFQKQFPGKTPTILSYLGAKGFGKLPQSDKPSYVVVSCSYVIPVKRVKRLVDALALVEIPLQWIHIGGGYELGETKVYAKQVLDSSKCKVNFIGDIPNYEVAEIYRRYQPDLFLTASESEGGAPISIVEACSCGIPAIATAVGGIPEIVLDGESGWLVSAEANAKEIADAINRFYALPFSEQLNMREKAFSIFESVFCASTNAANFLHILNRCLGLGY